MDEKKLYKEKLVRTFEAFDLFCKAHNIKYYAAYGTLLGAVRHHGMIPWDDDIDVWMLPDDYEKLRSYRGKVKGHYDIMDDRDENYWLLSLVKFVDTETTLWEIEHFPCVTGVYIDIFKLDYCDSRQAISLRKEYDNTSYNLTYSMMRHSFSKILNSFIHGHFKTFLRYLIESYYYRPQYNRLLKSYQNCLKKIGEANGDELVSYDGPYFEKEIFKKSWFIETLKMKFEDITIYIPNGYDEILTKLYGDYMQLPPEEKRVSRHSHYFLDLNRRWTLEEIKDYKKNHK